MTAFGAVCWSVRMYLSEIKSKGYKRLFRMTFHHTGSLVFPHCLSASVLEDKGTICSLRIKNCQNKQ